MSAEPMESRFELIKKLDHGTGFFYTAANGSVFLTGEGMLKKYSLLEDTLYTYNYERFGKPSYIDASNPSLVAVYFGHYERLLLLNSKLKELTRPFFTDEIEMYDVGAVVATPREELWFYDTYQNQLTRFNDIYIPVARSGVLGKWVPAGLTPVFFTCSPGRLFLNYPTWGILVLDRSGQYLTSYRITGILDFYVEDNFLYYYRDQKVVQFDLLRLESREIGLPDNPVILNAHIRGNTFIIQTPEDILIYRKKELEVFN
jgi:hypothetical protein